MKHPSSRDLYRYWNRQRGNRTMPERMDIDPTAVPAVLADTFLLGDSASGNLVFRLAGTRVCALFCREMKGQPFVPLFSKIDQSRIEELLGIVSNEAAPTVAGLTGEIADGATAELELLLLPLRHHGRVNTRVLGVLAPINPPYWLGSMPVTSLSLGGLRHLEPLAHPVPLLPARPGQDSARVRHGFVVYDGGRQ